MRGGGHVVGSPQVVPSLVRGGGHVVGSRQAVRRLVRGGGHVGGSMSIVNVNVCEICEWSVYLKFKVTKYDNGQIIKMAKSRFGIVKTQP